MEFSEGRDPERHVSTTTTWCNGVSRPPAWEFSPQVPGELFRVPTRANGRWSVTYRGTVRLGGIYYTLQTAARQSVDTPAPQSPPRLSVWSRNLNFFKAASRILSPLPGRLGQLICIALPRLAIFSSPLDAGRSRSRDSNFTPFPDATHRVSIASPACAIRGAILICRSHVYGADSRFYTFRRYCGENLFTRAQKPLRNLRQRARATAVAAFRKTTDNRSGPRNCIIDS